MSDNEDGGRLKTRPPFVWCLGESETTHPPNHVQIDIGDRAGWLASFWRVQGKFRYMNLVIRGGGGWFGGVLGFTVGIIPKLGSGRVWITFGFPSRLTRLLGKKESPLDTRRRRGEKGEEKEGTNGFLVPIALIPYPGIQRLPSLFVRSQ